MTNTEEQLPSISWKQLQSVLLSLADTPVKQMMVNHPCTTLTVQQPRR